VLGSPPNCAEHEQNIFEFVPNSICVSSPIMGVKFCNQRQHHVTNQRRNPVVKADLAQVNVIRCFLAAGQSEITVVNGITGNVVNKFLFHRGHVFSLSGRLKLDG